MNVLCHICPCSPTVCQELQWTSNHRSDTVLILAQTRGCDSPFPSATLSRQKSVQNYQPVCTTLISVQLCLIQIFADTLLYLVRKMTY